jgi:hypothetical protein
MAKTQKRQTRTTSTQMVNGTPAAPRTAVPLKAAIAQDFNPDYTLVKKDLKRIAILAVTFISSLVILSFFLR